MNDIRNTWKGIRNLIPLEQSASPFIYLLSQENDTVSKPKKIVNIFNAYFSTTAEKTKAKFRFSNKSFDEFLQHPNENCFFLRPTSSDEITNLVLLLNESKSVGPNGLPTKILNLLKNDISLQLSNIFNLSFSTGVFLLELKLLKFTYSLNRIKIKMIKLCTNTTTI